MKVIGITLAVLAATVLSVFTVVKLNTKDPEFESWWNVAGWSTWAHSRYRHEHGKSLNYPYAQLDPRCFGGSPTSIYWRVTPVAVCAIDVGDCSLPGDCPVIHTQYLLCAAHSTTDIANWVGRAGIGCIPINKP
jgi:hypothetical protein